ncbi:hypothetical protein FK519_27245 [Klebsiella pneumoniae]|nr:hypothetical protein [Klebsiella pneumoniae]
MQQAEEDVQFHYNKKKSVAAERNQAKIEKEEVTPSYSCFAYRDRRFCILHELKYRFSEKKKPNKQLKANSISCPVP